MSYVLREENDGFAHRIQPMRKDRNSYEEGPNKKKKDRNRQARRQGFERKRGMN